MRGCGGNRSKKRLTARARWVREIGWEYIKAMQEAGREIFPEDLPPMLEWEAPVWTLYEQISTQWRVSAKGAAFGLDYNPAIALMQHWGWPLDLGLKMLQAVELEMIKKVAI